jgi:hypothetical protein
MASVVLRRRLSAPDVSADDAAQATLALVQRVSGRREDVEYVWKRLPKRERRAAVGAGEIDARTTALGRTRPQFPDLLQSSVFSMLYEASFLTTPTDQPFEDAVLGYVKTNDDFSRTVAREVVRVWCREDTAAAANTLKATGLALLKSLNSLEQTLDHLVGRLPVGDPIRSVHARRAA